MKTNSPIDQGASFDPESFTKTDTVPQTEESKMIAKVGSSPEWKLITNYLRNRQDFYRAFLPDGKTAVAQAMTVKKLEEIGKQWVVATSIIGEIESWINQVEVEVNATKRRPGIR